MDVLGQPLGANQTDDYLHNAKIYASELMCCHFYLGLPY